VLLEIVSLYGVSLRDGGSSSAAGFLQFELRLAQHNKLQQAIFLRPQPSSRIPPPFFFLSRDPWYHSLKMAAAIKAINAKIRSNKVLDYFCSTREFSQFRISPLNVGTCSVSVYLA
jgi:hypothetical protein